MYLKWSNTENKNRHIKIEHTKKYKFNFKIIKKKKYNKETRDKFK